MKSARRILWAAALTYVAAALMSLLNITRWIRVLRFLEAVVSRKVMTGIEIVQRGLALQSSFISPNWREEALNDHLRGKGFG